MLNFLVILSTNSNIENNYFKLTYFARFWNKNIVNAVKNKQLFLKNQNVFYMFLYNQYFRCYKLEIFFFNKETHLTDFIRKDQRENIENMRVREFNMICDSNINFCFIWSGFSSHCKLKYILL